MFFSSIEERKRLLKEINRLLSKGMSNICLKVTIKKKWQTQKSLSPHQFLKSSNSCGYHWILKLLVAT